MVTLQRSAAARHRLAIKPRQLAKNNEIADKPLKPNNFSGF
jgi:hypothetical protein